MIFFWRPKPRFRPGQLAVLLPDEFNRGLRYMLIKGRRWVRPNGETEKRWVYDGDILEVVGGRLVFATSGTTFPEDRFMSFSGIDVEL